MGEAFSKSCGLCPNVATSQNTILLPGGKESYRILLPSDGSLRLTRIDDLRLAVRASPTSRVFTVRAFTALRRCFNNGGPFRA